MKELRLVEWRLGGIECVAPPRVGVIWEEMGTAANGRETTRQGIWAGAAPPAQVSCDLNNCQLLSRQGKDHRRRPAKGRQAHCSHNYAKSMNSTSRPKHIKQDLGKTNTQWHIGKQRNTPETSRGTSENFTQSLRTRHRNTLKPKGIGTVAR